MLKINYPNKKNSQNRKNNVPQGRGNSLETDINITNKIYAREKICFVYKKPVPIKILKVENKVIKNASFESKSTTDYNGVIKNGLYIDFEAKETRNKTLLPIANIHNHQIEHLKNVVEIGGFAFLLIRFASTTGTYLYEATRLLKLIERNNKSITKKELEMNGFYIEYKYSLPVDYYPYIQKIIKNSELEYDKYK